MYQPSPQMESPPSWKNLDLTNWCVSPLTLEATSLTMSTGVIPQEPGTHQMSPGIQPIIPIMMPHW